MVKSEYDGQIVFLSSLGCKKTIHAIEYLKSRGFSSFIVIIESELRISYTPSQIVFKLNHLRYLQTNGKNRYSRYKAGLRRVGLLLFLWSPQRIISPLFSVIGVLWYLIYRRLLTRKHVLIFKVPKISSPDTKEILKKNKDSWIFLSSSQWILSSDLLSDEFQIINMHPGILPRHRSLDSFFWSILQDDGIGVSAHIVDSGIDTGPILKRFFFVPSVDDDIFSLREKVDNLYPVLIYYLIKLQKRDELLFEVQGKEDGVHHKPMTIDELKETEKKLMQKYLVRK